MYSSSSSLTHHIFFPPRLEIVALKQNADGFPAYARHKLSLDRLLRYQSHRPASLAFGWFAANHCDNALLLQIVEQLGGAGTLLLIERPLKAAFAVAVSDLADRLRCKFEQTGDLRRGHPTSQAQQCDRSQHDPDLLNTTTQQLPERFL